MHSAVSAVVHVLTPRSLCLVIVAGEVGEIVLELVARVIAPLILGRSVQPALLAAELARALFGATMPMPAAFVFTWRAE